MVPKKAISPHLFLWIEAYSDFVYQHILMKIGKNLANSVSYKISKAFFHIL